MSAPTILLVHPGASFSTADVYTGLKTGLEMNGCTVVTFSLDLNLQFMNMVIDVAIDSDILTEPVDPFKLACRGLGDMCIHYEPDAVIAVSGGNLHPMAPLTLRELGAQRRKPMPVALLCTESPYHGEREIQQAACYDVVFVNERCALPSFRYNERVYYLPHAYNPRVHTPGPPEAEKACDVFFVGTGFPERKALFDGVDWAGISFTKLGYGWSGWAHQSTLTPQDVTDNAEVVGYYRSAAINLNQHRTTTTLNEATHIDANTAESLGPRAYEIAACGGFQLCDDSRAELCEVFGDAVVTYRAGDSADLERQLRYWLAHPERRQETARIQRAAVRSHSWDRRATQVLEVLL